MGQKHQVIVMDGTADALDAIRRAFDRCCPDVTVLCHEYNSLETPTINAQTKLILIGHNLPEEEVLSIVKRFRSVKEAASVPVLILTDSDYKEVEGFYRCGVNSVLEVPKDEEAMNQLMARLRNYWLDLNLSSPLSRRK